jgi:hypothetical protein
MGKFITSVDDHLILNACAMLTDEDRRNFQAQGQACPPPIPIRLVIDTGSRRSTLIPSVIAQFTLSPRGWTRVHTSLASGKSNLFAVRFEFPDTGLGAIPKLLVARLGLPSSLPAFHGVIGRDVLRRWEYFRYEGRCQRLIIRDTPHPLLRWLTG